MAVSSARTRRLGKHLRSIRERADLQQDAVAKDLGWQPSKLSRFEGGQRLPGIGDLWALLRTYGVDSGDPTWAALTTLVRGAREPTWWAPHTSALRPEYTDLIDLERDASSALYCAPVVVPGLLQTSDYATALMQSTIPPPSTDEVEHRVQVRMGRQARLWEVDPPLDCWAVIDEFVLHRQIGSEQVMTAQLRHLVDSIKRGITVQILPRTAGGAIGAGGPFLLLRFNNEPPIVYIEGVAGGLFVEGADVTPYITTFDALRAMSLGPPQSARLITAILTEGEPWR